jgi:hypothetical protein
MPVATYSAWFIEATTLIMAAIWYLKKGNIVEAAALKRTAMIVSAVFAFNGIVNSIWLGIIEKGSLKEALSADEIRTALLTALIMTILGYALAKGIFRIINSIIKGKEDS